MATFQREFQRRNREVVSAYDADVVGYDPNPTSAQARFEDPVLSAMTAPLTSAMLDHLGRTLNYRPEGRYKLLNGSISGAWRWGRGRGQPENISELRQSLALDPKLRVLVAHGFTDLVTPYFASQLLLNQLPGIRTRAARHASGLRRRPHVLFARQVARQRSAPMRQGSIEEALKARAGNGG